MEKTGALILAAGGSSRLGQPKQFLLHQGKTLLERAVDAAADCSPIVVVAGRDAPRVEELLRKRPLDIVDNAQWERGIGNSIRAGLARLIEIAPSVDAVVILLCDQPSATAAIVDELRVKRALEQKPMVACHYAGGLGVPALFSRSAFPALLALDDHSGAKRLLGSATDVSVVMFPEGSIDIDTTADMESHLGPQLSPTAKVV